MNFDLTTILGQILFLIFVICLWRIGSQLAAVAHSLKNIGNTMMAEEFKRQQQERIKAAERRINETE